MAASPPPIMDTCSDSYSTIFGYLSIYCWLVAQIPQQVENYRNKRCDGISFTFLLLWFFGDLTSLVGCILTNQLQFQIYLAIYFLYNDCVLFVQWYYYTFVYIKKHHHHHQHQHHHSGGSNHNNNNINTIPIIDGVLIQNQQHQQRRQSFLKTGLVIASGMVGSVKGVPINASNAVISNNSWLTQESIGFYISWICAALYLGSRFPQLYKNFQRKSVDGISPLLFFTAIIANACYSVSILVNCQFNYEYLMKELPYILGSSGTIIFDVMYFYQRAMYGRIADDEQVNETTRLL